MSLSAARANYRLSKNDTLTCMAMTSSNGLAIGSVILLCGLFGQMGCQAVQNRMVQRSEQCGELCARARQARENGDVDQANQCINAALRQKPNDMETRRELAETMWSSGRREEAIAEYLNLCEERPTEVKLYERLSVMQWETNQRFAAANTAMWVLRQDPLSKDALLIKSRNEVNHNKLDEALISYIKLSQLDAGDPTILKELGELHLKRGQPDRACPLFRTAIQQSQSNSAQRSEIEWLLGVAYARSNRWSMAVDILEQSISNRKATADDWCLLGWAHKHTGDLERARADLQRAIQSDAEAETTRQLSQELEAATKFAQADSQITPASFQMK